MKHIGIHSFKYQSLLQSHITILMILKINISGKKVVIKKIHITRYLILLIKKVEFENIGY